MARSVAISVSVAASVEIDVKPELIVPVIKVHAPASQLQARRAAHQLPSRHRALIVETTASVVRIVSVARVAKERRKSVVKAAIVALIANAAQRAKSV